MYTINLLVCINYIERLILMPKEVPIHTIIEKLEEVQSTYSVMVKKLQKEMNISASSIPIMEIIQDEKMTLKEITEKSVLDKSTVSRQINQMVKKEMVKREPGNDRRFAYFSLSERAKKAYRTYLFELNKNMTAALYSWPEEEKQILYVLLGRLDRSLTNISTKG